MRSLVLALAATLVSGNPQQAAAADFSAVEVRKIFHDYAICVVKGHHKLASDAILADVDNSQIDSKYADLISSECMGQVGGAVEAKFTGDSYRYALADALVNFDFKDAGPTSFADRLPLAHLIPPTQAELDAALAKTKNRRKQDELKAGFERANLIVALSRYGECVAREDPVAARYWILTKPDVSEEMSRINALRPAFSNCLMGGTTRFTKDILRGAVAINYYRLAMATKQPTAGTSK